MKKKKKTKPSSSSSNPINAPFHVSIAATAVAQICHSIGFKSTHTTALRTLTNITVRYLSSLATSAATSAISNGRTECNVYDVIRGMDDVSADVGFEGNSRLSESGMWKDVMRFVEWNREVPFAKPLVTSSEVPRGNEMVTSPNGKGNGNEGEVKRKVTSSSSSHPMETRGKEMVTSLNGECNGNEGKSEEMPRGKRKVTSLYGECNGNESVCKKVFTAVNEGKSESENEVMPRGKEMVTSPCENGKLKRKRNYCGENEAVNEEGEKKRKIESPRGEKQMMTSLFGECNGNYCGEKRAVNEGKNEMRHVPKWLPTFPDRSEKEVFAAVTKRKKSEVESEKDKEKVNYYNKEVSELHEVRKKVMFEIKGLKTKRVKDVIKVYSRGVGLRNGICKGGKRILCRIYQDLDGKKYGKKGDYGVVKSTGMVKVKSVRN